MLKTACMRRGLAACLALLLIAQLIPIGASSPVAAATKPNIVVVMVDDMDARMLDDMDARMLDDLPGLQEQLVKPGLSFNNFYAPAPVCCPARASFLRGQYPHNTGVLLNGGANGGFDAFRKKGNESSTIATWLQGAGYRTALIGKYLNDYEDAPKHVPPGWNRWFAYAGKGKYTHYLVSDQGKVHEYGKKKRKKHYQTDVLANKGVSFITSTSASQPIFLYLAPSAPHEPATPAERNKKAKTVRSGAPRPPSFNEADVSDKPVFWSDKKPLSRKAIKKIDHLY